MGGRPSRAGAPPASAWRTYRRAWWIRAFTVPSGTSSSRAMSAYSSDRHRLAVRTVGIGSDEPESGGVFQLVIRYAPGRGPQVPVTAAVAVWAGARAAVRGSGVLHETA